jgi:glycerol-3-phosphate dehydrogenase subunit C
MLKFEWPLILPDNENVKRLSEATFDIDEYVVDYFERARAASRNEGIA